MPTVTVEILRKDKELAASVESVIQKQVGGAWTKDGSKNPNFPMQSEFIPEFSHVAKDSVHPIHKFEFMRPSDLTWLPALIASLSLLLKVRGTDNSVRVVVDGHVLALPTSDDQSR